jgi:hypothetical protein
VLFRDGFLGQFKVYKWSDGIEELSEEAAPSLPSRQAVLE